MYFTSGAKNSKGFNTCDYQNTVTIDNEAYEQSIAITSSPKVQYNLILTCIVVI